MRNAIIERVFCQCLKDDTFKTNCFHAVEAILKNAGFWELLEAADEIYNEFGYILPLPHKGRLDAAIAKAKGT